MSQVVSSRASLESQFSIHVDLPVEQDDLAQRFTPSIGQRLFKIMNWCSRTLGAGNWGWHGHIPQAGGPQFVRFYFSNPADAEQFREEWLGAKPNAG